MKNIITLTVLFIALLACSSNKESAGDPAVSTNIKLDGYWKLVHSDYDFEKALEKMDCPDPEAMALYDPRALGSHFCIRGDSILFFRYPYRYFGSAHYKISGDSLFVNSDPSFADKFSMMVSPPDSLRLHFRERVTSTCIITAKAEYARFTPDIKRIDQLIRDSVSYEPLVGKWWYLRKQIGYEDGTEPTILKFPKGMPDSILVTQEMISSNSPKPYIDLKLNRRNVRLRFQDADEYSFTLTPTSISDKILFSDFYDYGGGHIDTVYYDVIYHR
jgi:hypothetical protein